MGTVYGYCDISPETYADEKVRQVLEENMLAIVIREHGKLITMGWSEVFSDSGDLMHRLAMSYKERSNG